jgi:phosphate transport system ATP-binding protein
MPDAVRDPLVKPPVPEVHVTDTPASQVEGETVFDMRELHFYYGSFRAVRNVTLRVLKHEVTALIGPSGCGKSTILRCLNRMNDLIPGTRVEGTIEYHGVDLYGDDVDPIEVRRRIGMVFQKPNPFPKSIYDNVAFGPKVQGLDVGTMADHVERSLRRAALWDEVKDKLKHSALSLSGGQQQRLCIARMVAVKPEVLLLDEPTSALDIGHQQAVLDLVETLRTQDGLTVVAAMHDLTLAGHYGRRVVLLHGGRVVADGSPQDVLVPHRLADVYSARVEVVLRDAGPAVLPLGARP